MTKTAIRMALTAAGMLTSVAFGSTITCAAGPGNVISAGSPSSFSITCGGETFSNFEVESPDGGAAGIVDVQGASYNTSTGQVTLLANPNLSGPSQDELFLYEASGDQVSSLGLALGGSGASISETACSGPIALSGPLADLCQPGQFLGNTSDFSNDPSAPVFAGIPPVSSVFVSKDIETGPASGSQLSEVDQTFQVVPEPSTLLLLGAGLVLLGLARRRVRNTGSCGRIQEKGVPTIS